MLAKNLVRMFFEVPVNNRLKEKRKEAVLYTNMCVLFLYD